MSYTLPVKAGTSESSPSYFFGSKVDGGRIPAEIFMLILFQLQFQDWANCRLVSHKWNQNVIDTPEWKALTGVRSSCEVWQTHFGSPKDTPPLPLKMMQELKSKDPLHPGKLKEETHIPMLFPATVENSSLNLNNFEKLINTKSIKFSSFVNTVRDKIGNMSIQNPYWALVTRGLVPNTTDMSYEEQVEVLRENGYEPLTALEATVCTIMRDISSKENLLPKNVWTRTVEIAERHESRFTKKVTEHHVVIGNLGENGLQIHYHKMDNPFTGMMGIQRFTSSKS